MYLSLKTMLIEAFQTQNRCHMWELIFILDHIYIYACTCVCLVCLFYLFCGVMMLGTTNKDSMFFFKPIFYDRNSICLLFFLYIITRLDARFLINIGYMGK